jgi:glycosyltransferase involved in cell wall biosynthesis
MVYVLTLAVPDGTGAARMAASFGHALRDRGHEVIFVHGSGADDAGQPGSGQRLFLEELTEGGFDLHLLRGLGQPRRSVARELGKVLLRKRANAVISFHPRDQVAALWASSLTGIPSVVSAQTLLRFWGNPLAVWAKRILYRRVMSRYASLVICSSAAVQEQIIYQFGVPRTRTVVLPNAIRVSSFRSFDEGAKQSLRKTLGLASSEIVLLNVGRLDAQKGQDILLRAFAKLREQRPATLLLVGDVAASAHYKQTVKFAQGLRDFVREEGLDSHVRFLGWRNDIGPLMGISDIYVHSARWEGFPLAVLEAMASSRVVIATDCVGRPDGWVDGVHGYFVPSENADALCSAILRVVDAGDSARSQMGIAARQLAQHRYDMESVGSRFVSLVENASLPFGDPA